MNENEYEDDSVYYCKRCLSLGIVEMPFMKSQSYCKHCGAVDVGVAATFEEWETMYKEKYGHAFVVKNKPKEHAGLDRFNF